MLSTFELIIHFFQTEILRAYMNYIFFDTNDKNSHIVFFQRYRYNICKEVWIKERNLMKIAICDDDRNELFRILSVLADYQLQRNIEFSYKPFDNSTELASALLRERYIFTC